MNLSYSLGSGAGIRLAALGILAPACAGLLSALLCRWRGRASAATRHLIWTLAFVTMAVGVPVGVFHLQMPVPILPARTVVSRPAAFAQPLPRTSLARLEPAAPSSPIAAQGNHELPWRHLLAGLWLAGFLAVSFLSLAGTLRLRKIIHRSRTADDLGTATLWTELLSTAGLRTSPRLLVSADVRIPLVAGLWRPVVILPETALQWPSPMLKAALIHELAHIRRNDLPSSAFARLVASFYWYHPMAWYGLRSLQAEAEMAADDSVVVTEARPVDYAESLLLLVRALRESESALFPAIGMLQSQGIEARVERILDPSRPRLAPRRLSRVSALVGGALAAALALTVRPVAAVPPPAMLGLTAVANFGTVRRGLDEIQETPAVDPAITDLRTQMPGTTWKAMSEEPLRGGLAARLTFTESTVKPAGYHYEVDHHDSTVRIFFNHGDTQLLLLTDNGRHLRFTFGGRDYAYELLSK